MNEYQSLSHTKWECKYHVVFIPKYRRKVLYGHLRKHLGEVFRELARHRESLIEEGHLRPDHVHMLLSIPPKYAVAQVVGDLKGKSAIYIARTFGGKVRNFVGAQFWARGYFVSTVGRDEKVIRQYIEHQEAEDQRLEALRKLLGGSFIVKFTLDGWSEFAEHQVQVAEVDHRSGRSWGALIVLAVPPRPAGPRIRALHHPAVAHGRETWAAWGTGLHCESPAGPIFRQPRVERRIIIFGSATDCLQAGTVVRTDLREQGRSGGAIVNLGARNQARQQQAQGSDQHMPLASLDFLAAVVAAVCAADLGGLHRLTSAARRAGRGLTSGCPADLRPHCRQQRGPGPLIAPLDKVGVDRALRQQILGQPVPLAPTAVQIEQRVNDLSHVHFARVPSPVGLRGRNQRSQDSPLLVRQIRGIRLPILSFHRQVRAPSLGKYAPTVPQIMLFAKPGFRRASDSH